VVIIIDVVNNDVYVREGICVHRGNNDYHVYYDDYHDCVDTVVIACIAGRGCK
jgi:hypothetical protein